MTAASIADVPVTELEVPALTAGQLQALHALQVEADREELPADRPTPYDEFVADLRRVVSAESVRRWAAWEGERAVGFASLELRNVDNTHVAWGWIIVAPDRRRRGLGTLLLDTITAAAEQEGRTTIGLPARQDLPGARFLPAFGFEEKLVEHHNRMVVAEVDVAMLHDWTKRAKERAPDYELRFWTAPTPPELLDDFSRIFHVMNTAPRGELDMEDEVMTPEQMEERERTNVERGIDQWTFGAVAPDGSLAGFTELFFSRWRDDIAFQGNTGVDPTHRDRGLGRWLKAAMLLRLLDERPTVEKIDTWNAGSNAPMLNINHALGFRPIGVWTDFQISVSALQASLARHVAAR